MKKKTLIWEDNNEPPKNYIWIKSDGKAYEYNNSTKSWQLSNLVGGEDNTATHAYSVTSLDQIENPKEGDIAVIPEHQEEIPRTNNGRTVNTNGYNSYIMDYTGAEPSDIQQTTFMMTMQSPVTRSSNEFTFPQNSSGYMKDMYYFIWDIPEGHEDDWHFYITAPQEEYEVVNGEWVKREYISSDTTQSYTLIEDASQRTTILGSLSPKEGDIYAVKYVEKQTLTPNTTNDISTAVYTDALEIKCTNAMISMMANMYSNLGTITITAGTSSWSLSFDSSTGQFVFNMNSFNGSIGYSLPNIRMFSSSITITDSGGADDPNRLSQHLSFKIVQLAEFHECKSGTWVNRNQEQQIPQITIDSTPTQNSNNAVSSGGVYNAINNISGGGNDILVTGNIAPHYIINSSIITSESDPSVVAQTLGITVNQLNDLFAGKYRYIQDVNSLYSISIEQGGGGATVVYFITPNGWLFEIYKWTIMGTQYQTKRTYIFDKYGRDHIDLRDNGAMADIIRAWQSTGAITPLPHYISLYDYKDFMQTSSSVLNASVSSGSLLSEMLSTLQDKNFITANTNDIKLLAIYQNDMEQDIDLTNSSLLNTIHGGFLGVFDVDGTQYFVYDYVN